jgi:hypothetical protein
MSADLQTRNTQQRQTTDKRTSRVPTKPAAKLLHKTEPGSQPPPCFSQAHPMTHNIMATVSTRLHLLQSQMTVTAVAKAWGSLISYYNAQRRFPPISTQCQLTRDFYSAMSLAVLYPFNLRPLISPPDAQTNNWWQNAAFFRPHWYLLRHMQAQPRFTKSQYTDTTCLPQFVALYVGCR